MQVGVLGGTGPAGRALAARLASVGIEVTIGSRSPERAQETCDAIRARWPGRELRLVPGANAIAASGEIIVVATPWDAAASTATSVAEHLEGKVVISMANAVAKVGDELQFVVPPRGSVAVSVQDAVPGALVATAFHHLPARSLGDLDTTLECDVLVCSDHPSAIKVTSELVSMVPGLRALDAGSMSNAGALESFTAVLLRLNARYRTRAAVRITGVDA